jgi:phosphatidylglycerophosphate synthase
VPGIAAPRRRRWRPAPSSRGFGYLAPSDREAATSHDTTLHRLVRLGVRPLARTPVTPNQLTAARLATGIAAAGALAVGREPWPLIGAAVFVVSMLLDRADGTLARMKGIQSEFGHRFDLLADSACNALVFVGLGVGLRGSWLGAWAIPMGAIAGLAIVSILAQVMRAERLAGPRAGELGGRAGFDPDDGILAVPLLIALGASEPLLVAAAVVAPAFAVVHHFLLARKQRAAR